ncbi:MAG: dicarboxylate/amino acid:cation symporter, partial [Alphaproteobacteria bacterium]|nr:dicarboxylate/amino acid:cation symporter [Alphaproteobacteria bacterium]
IIPTTVNIHLLGDALAIPLTGLALLWFKTGVMPGFETYAIFTVMFAIAKFSAAGVPGGGVLVILPVLQKYLGMDQELITLMTTIYILQDSIFTASNVMANGAFSMIVERVCRCLFGNGNGDDDNSDEEKENTPYTLQNSKTLEPCVTRARNR